ncbi:hypothetical protein [Mycobacterium deserti]|uniref:Uncharacterized protein n=1 Tax=Mycobacterium deserti TaxID=2978347 RepID=A0ABT2M9P2_9MYCO|nr:hypothetical protein [Mycobacterium deserti]MCT7658988.1 hypothetical protein [Mycobacterium deserti]
MTRAARAAAEADEPVEHVVALLRERLYGAISCLATLAVLARYTTEETSAWARILDVAVATGGLWAASLLADWVAHLAVYSTAPRGRKALRMLQSSGQILQAAVLPIAVLAVAGFDALDTDTATWIAGWVLVGELGVIALLAVRRTQLPWWQQALTVAGLTGVGALVLGIKILAH